MKPTNKSTKRSMNESRLTKRNGGSRSLLNERIISAEKLLTEALDKKQVASAVSAIKTLRKIDFGSLKTMADARTKVVDAAVKAVGGQEGLVDKIKNFFKRPGGNPIVDSLAFVSSATSFFTDVSEFITALGDDDLTVLQAIAPEGSPEAAEEAPQSAAEYVKAFALSQKKSTPAKNLYKIIERGFKPEGELQKLGSGWINRYMDGKKGMQALTAEMLEMKVGDLKRLASTVTSALKPVAQQIADIPVADAATGDSGATEGSKAGSEAGTGGGSSKERALAMADRIKELRPGIKPDHLKAALEIILGLEKDGYLKVLKQ